MAVVAPVVPDFNGEELIWAAASAGGDQVAHDPRRVLMFFNSSGGSITVTVTIEATVMGKAVPNQTVAIPGGDYFVLRTGPQNVTASTGNIGLTYSTHVGLSLAVVHVPA